MDRDDIPEVGLLLVIVVIFVCAAYSAGRRGLQVEAVKAGIAEWIVNNDGTTKFSWKERAK